MMCRMAAQLPYIAAWGMRGEGKSACVCESLWKDCRHGRKRQKTEITLIYTAAHYKDHLVSGACVIPSGLQKSKGSRRVTKLGPQLGKKKWKK